jgi:enoyl-CoA hydratase/carnithine racemase
MPSAPVTPFAQGALELRVAGDIAELTLNRPRARNALNLAMWRDLPEALSYVAALTAARCLIIRGAGGHFASGADIAEFPVVFADRQSALDYGRLIETATGAVAALHLPVIAMIEGYCIGAGLAIALACDLRVAAEDAKLGAPPAKLGLIYSLGDTRRLIQAVGASRAKAMLFTGALRDAPDALRLGLVDEIHPPESLDAAAMARAETMAGLSSWSIRHAKAVVGLVLQGVEQETDLTRGWFADAVEGPDFAEGLAAFNEKRKPRFGPRDD